jgi:hypothetical protein
VAAKPVIAGTCLVPGDGSNWWRVPLLPEVGWEAG